MEESNLKSPTRPSLFRACKSPTKLPWKEKNGSENIFPENGNSMDQISTKQKKEVVKSDTKSLAKDLLSNFPEIDQYFDIVKKVGEGTFSKVYLAKYKDDEEQMFALKHLVPTSSPGRIENELNCLKIIGGSNNVIGINSTLRKDDHVVFILPYYSHQKFSDFFRSMLEKDIQKYMKNLFIALNHVHKKKIIHRDVKPSNFIYCKDSDTYSLIDFGLAMPIPGTGNSLLNDYNSKKACNYNKHNSHLKSSCRHSQKSLCTLCKSRSRQSAPRAGTPGFRSPEVLLKYPHQTTAVDMWSAGVILLCILSRRYPFFKAKDDFQALAQIMALFGSDKVEKMAAEIGKDLIVNPPIVQKETLLEQCHKLARRDCPKHKHERYDEMSKAKKKRIEDFGGNFSNNKKPLRNTRSMSDSDSTKSNNGSDKKYEGNNIQCFCIGNGAYDLLERLLELNPLKRITAEEALMHPFIKKDKDVK